MRYILKRIARMPTSIRFVVWRMPVRFMIAALAGMAVVGVLAGTGPLTAGAQELEKMPRIGYLGPRAEPHPSDKAFQQGLRDLGWIEGQNIAIEYRWAARKWDRLPGLAEELVRLKVDIMV